MENRTEGFGAQLLEVETEAGVGGVVQSSPQLHSKFWASVDT